MKAIKIILIAIMIIGTEWIIVKCSYGVGYRNAIIAQEQERNNDKSDLMACEEALDSLQDKYSEEFEKAFEEGKESILEQF